MSGERHAAGVDDEAESFPHLVVGELVAVRIDELLQQVDRIAQATRSDPRDLLQRVFGALDPLFARDELEPPDGGFERNAPEIEPLAARDDGRRHLMRFRRRQHEDDVGRRLFQRLQQRVEGRLRQHMHLVNEVDLVGINAARGSEVRLLAQAADLVDTAITRRVQLDQVERAAGEIRLAAIAGRTRLAVP